MNCMHPTLSQKDLFALLNSDKTDILIRGGARSGKTRGIMEWLVMLCCVYPGIKILTARLRFAHAKVNLWNDSIDKAIKGRERYARKSESDHTVYFTNGSQLLVDGLDDKDRVDKILGREYAVVFINEASEISWDTIQTVKSRLSQQINWFQNKILYDMNPKGLKHWSKKLHIDHIDPDTGDPLDEIRISQLGHIKMNATDNNNEIEKYLARGYIANILERYSGQKKKRFLEGEYGDVSGLVFESYEIIDEIPEEVRNRVPHAYGVDFGYMVHPAAVIDVYDDGDTIWLDEKLYGTGMRNVDIYNKAIDAGCDASARYACDIAEQKSIDDLVDLGLQSAIGAKKGPGSILNGINKIQSRKIKVTRGSIHVIDELDNYSWELNRQGEPTGMPIDSFNHAIDAIRYALVILDVPEIVFY